MFKIKNIGERNYKSTWTGNWSSINGTGTIYYVPENATLYASPYLVITPQGYTKHYYAEAERTTSQLGKGRFVDVGTPVKSESLVQVKLQAVTGNVDPPATLTAPATPYFSYLDTLTNQQNAASTLYFYHPDHLGFASWITYTDGEAVQHLHYLPWGEDYVNQRTTDFSARYTFSAKEKDVETGLSYFGARYYNSDLSIWLSVDPMSDKYASLSPYNYCADNPIKLVDPNGESVWIVGDDGQRYEYKKDGGVYLNGEKVNDTDIFTLEVQSSLTKLINTSPTANKILARFVEDPNFHIEIRRGNDEDCSFDHKTITNDYLTGKIIGMTGEIKWNPLGKGVPVRSTEFTGVLEYNGTMDLIHEFAHAFDKSRGTQDDSYDYLSVYEWVACYYENICRGEMGCQIRTHYGAYRDANWNYHGTLPSILKNKQPFLPEHISKFFSE